MRLPLQPPGARRRRRCVPGGLGAAPPGAGRAGGRGASLRAAELPRPRRPPAAKLCGAHTCFKLGAAAAARAGAEGGAGRP